MEPLYLTNNPIPSGLEEIYYYITFECNLRCRHCYVGDNLAPRTHADFDLILATLGQCHEGGARKVTFLGGEPTLHPDYLRILNTAAKIGYRRIIVDSNGVTRYPVPKNQDFLNRFAVRFSFEGISPKTHDTIRGKGTFEKTFLTLQRVIAEKVRAEVTLTLNAINVTEIPQMIEHFTREGVSEINFHFMSLMGNGKLHQDLGLTPKAIIKAQEQLAVLKRQSTVSIRYPKLLVRKNEFQEEIAKGYKCRVFSPQILLIFPQGDTRRCPLEITPSLEQQLAVENTANSTGCPLWWRLLPEGVPNDFVMTCISWKNC